MQEHFEDITLYDLENADKETRNYIINHLPDYKKDLFASEIQCHFETLVENCNNKKIPFKTIKKYDTLYSLLTGWNLF